MLFNLILGILLQLLSYIIQVVGALVVAFIFYYVVWLLTSMFWWSVHEKSYNAFVKKVKSIFKKVIKSKEND